MGEEIHSSQFDAQDYARFEQRLQQETALLRNWLQEGRLATTEAQGGFELEAWLVDEQLQPAPINEAFLKRLDTPLASPELASFNFEVNSTPRYLAGEVFTAMHTELTETWRHCWDTAAALDARAVMIGILPTVENESLTLANMSRMQRYRALNREVVRMRHGKPLVLDINGEEHLRVTHRDVMLESAATSFQIHLKLTPQNAVPLFNASIILAGPMVALSANSPFLFGKSLWDESRIPVFEQAVAVGGYDAARFGPIRRVTFGDGYVKQSLMECFEDNLAHYPVMLPVDLGEAPEQLAHLRMHNGTIWRWNRPLIGFEEDGTPHLRVEHRVVPAGPTLVDTIANAAFYYGAVTALANMPIPPRRQLAFDRARDNFYAAARLGLRARQQWFEDKQLSASELIQKVLLPLAREGLAQLGVSESDSRRYLDVIAQRVASGKNGARWQRDYVKQHGKDMRALTAAYLERQQQGEPVHEWSL
ncbi:glutamate-cysteine ligase family protein [Thiohalophilus sp.]|uniref:glutamate-cysteine ligase family protein n=1 Tax=Thiohalophilus sp. TaxID=3028392 RepID=UPI0039752126